MLVVYVFFGMCLFNDIRCRLGRGRVIIDRPLAAVLDIQGDCFVTCTVEVGKDRGC